MEDRITEFEINVDCSEEQAKTFVGMLDRCGGNFEAMASEFPDASENDLKTISFRPSFSCEATKEGLSVWSHGIDGDFEMAVTLVHLWMRRENVAGSVPATAYWHGDELGSQSCVISGDGIAWQGQPEGRAGRADGGDFEREAYMRYMDHWFKEHVGMGDVTLASVMEFADGCREAGMDAESFLVESGFGGSAPACFDEFMETEMLNPGYMEAILPEKDFKRWKAWYGMNDREEISQAM